MMINTTRLSVSIPNDIMNQIKEDCEKNGRSLSKLTALLYKRYIDEKV